MSDLQELRVRIDEIDDELVRLLGKRATVAKLVAQRKLEDGQPVFDRLRERRVIERAAESEAADLLGERSVRLILSTIVGECRALVAREMER